jgi:hypothetical protein
MIELKHLIGSPDVTTEKGRAVPMPYKHGIIGRLKDATAVLKGNAHAIKWPESGDLEKALK